MLTAKDIQINCSIRVYCALSMIIQPRHIGKPG